RPRTSTSYPRLTRRDGMAPPVFDGDELPSERLVAYQCGTGPTTNPERGAAGEEADVYPGPAGSQRGRPVPARRAALFAQPLPGVPPPGAVPSSCAVSVCGTRTAMSNGTGGSDARQVEAGPGGRRGRRRGPGRG